jgi:hypothetical protein
VAVANPAAAAATVDRFIDTPPGMVVQMIRTSPDHVLPMCVLTHEKVQVRFKLWHRKHDSLRYAGEDIRRFCKGMMKSEGINWTGPLI